jgi:AraC-like DNA-binding protein
VRTLQRKLKNENVSFQLLVDKTQKDLAINYVSDKHYSISEIAYILGYSEPTAFSRAFKRWTGKNPSDY